MEGKFTIQQRRAINEKVEQLKKIKEGKMPAHVLAGMITDRRLNWLKGNKHLLRQDLPLPEAAYRLITHNHMKVVEGISINGNSGDLTRVECRNFCPYLEACNKLKLDTRYVCKQIGEPSIIAFMKEINPRLNFFRDYSNIRPHSDYCLEFVEELTK